MITRLALFTLLSLTVSVDSLAADSKPKSNKEIAIHAMMEMIGYRDMTAIDRYFAEPYIQHRTDVPDGLKALKEFQLAMLTPRPNFNTNIYRGIEDGDFVILHSVYEGSPRANGAPLAAFDLFRFKNGRIVEHWDVLNVQGERNLSGHSTVDGPAAIADLQKTEANRAVVTQFVDAVFAKGQVDRAGDFIDGKRYIEHALMGSDGVEAFKAKTKGNPKAGYKVHRIVAEGNFVAIEAEGAGGTQIHYDMYRLQGGKIVEHWDVQNTVPPRSGWKNDHGPF